jgi:uracil-DNA glycosylase
MTALVRRRDQEAAAMVDFDPGAPPSADFDPGPPKALARHFAAVPAYAEEDRALFWWDWGPVFYRGRLNGSARFLGIASDPGPTERVVGRTLVGDAGQRVQGFLAKLGLTHSYVLVNAFPYAVHPGKVYKALPLLQDPDHLTWRNHLLDVVTGPDLQAVVAFGGNAQAALHLWDRLPDVPVFEVPHPSDHDATRMLDAWRAAVPGIRAVVTPDPDGDPTLPSYGDTFAESDYRPIPPADLPFGLPAWMGDDSWGRTASPRHNNAVARAAADPDHQLVWQAPLG